MLALRGGVFLRESAQQAQTRIEEICAYLLQDWSDPISVTLFHAQHCVPGEPSWLLGRLEHEGQVPGTGRCHRRRLKASDGSSIRQQDDHIIIARDRVGWDRKSHITSFCASV